MTKQKEVPPCSYLAKCEISAFVPGWGIRQQASVQYPFVHNCMLQRHGNLASRQSKISSCMDVPQRLSNLHDLQLTPWFSAPCSIPLLTVL